MIPTGKKLPVPSTVAKMWGSDADKHEFGAILPLRDRKAAVVRLRVLADRGYAPAQFALAVAYFDGEGVGRDYPSCYHNCLAAAEQDYPSAVGMIGNFHATATPKYEVCEYNPAEAVRWWRRSAESGNSGSQFNLATACSTGSGIGKDALEACIWASLAVHCSPIRLRPAEALRDRMTAELNSGQRADVDVRLSALKARLPLPWSEHLDYWRRLAREA